jgi:hypothetical protein
MPLLNYTTKIDADKTAQEIARCLSMHGAQAVLTEYDEKDGYVTAISFKITMDGKPLGFRLPCDWKPVLEILKNDPKVPQHMVDRVQAVRVAWRIVKDWVEAQMALVETRMVTTDQVFLPYAVTKSGKTLYEQIQANPRFLLEGDSDADD